MPTEPAQQVLALFELCLFLAGVILALWLVGNGEARRRWFGTHALGTALIPGSDFILIAALVFVTGLGFQTAAQLWLGAAIGGDPDHQGLALFVYSIANYAGALVAWKFAYPSLRRSWLVAPDEPPAPPPPLPWPRALRYGAATLMVALPILSLVSIGWNWVVQHLDLPMLPQDVIAIFTNTRSSLVITGMLLVACVLAPIYEELLFRAGLYRFCRQRLGRGPALLISGACFGALHLNLTGFLPLAVLGMGLAIVYEATGSIRVAIVAHGLFNLNTVLVLLSGLPQAVPQ